MEIKTIHWNYRSCVGGEKFGGGGGWGRSVVRRVLRKNPSWGTWWMQRMDIFQNKTMINIECTSLYQQ